MPAVALPGRGERPLHTALRRVELAGQAEPGEEDKQDKVNFSMITAGTGGAMGPQAEARAAIIFAAEA